MKVIGSAVVVAALGLWGTVQLFGSDTAAEGEARARSHVETTCLGCHPGSQLDVVVTRRLDDLESLDRFLAGHHVPDTALRAEVVAYLRTRLAAPPTES